MEKKGPDESESIAKGKEREKENFNPEQADVTISPAAPGLEQRNKKTASQPQQMGPRSSTTQGTVKDDDTGSQRHQTVARPITAQDAANNHQARPRGRPSKRRISVEPTQFQSPPRIKLRVITPRPTSVEKRAQIKQVKTRLATGEPTAVPVKVENHPPVRANPSVTEGSGVPEGTGSGKVTANPKAVPVNVQIPPNGRPNLDRARLPALGGVIPPIRPQATVNQQENDAPVRQGARLDSYEEECQCHGCQSRQGRLDLTRNWVEEQQTVQPARPTRQYHPSRALTTGHPAQQPSRVGQPMAAPRQAARPTLPLIPPSVFGNRGSQGVQYFPTISVPAATPNPMYPYHPASMIPHPYSLQHVTALPDRPVALLDFLPDGKVRTYMAQGWSRPLIPVSVGTAEHYWITAVREIQCYANWKKTPAGQASDMPAPHVLTRLHNAAPVPGVQYEFDGDTLRYGVY